MEYFFESLNKVRCIIEYIFSISAKRLWSRLLVICIFCFAPIIAYYALFNYFLYQAQAEDSDNKDVIELTTSINIYKSVYAELKLCIDSESKKHRLTDWYCNEAIDAYKHISNGWPPERRTALIDKKAYEGMLIDISYYTSVLESRLSEANTKKEYYPSKLDLIVNGWSFLFLILFCITISIYTFYRFHSMAKKFS
ncbi:hypothetical protein ACSZM5_09545 [Aeromonas hydrophila]